MLVPQPLLRGRLIARRQRFLMDIRVRGGRVVTVHCPNSGSMEGCLAENAEVLASPKTGQGRLSHVAEWIRGPDGWIGINTHRSNAIVGEALRAGRIPELAGYRSVRAEVPYGRSSRVDFLLTAPGLPNCYVEVKNTTWPGPDGALAFPDAVTERGRKHLRELCRRVRLGDRAVLLFLANRPHGSFVRACHERDPAYARALGWASRQGLEILSYRTTIEPPSVVLAERVPVVVGRGGAGGMGASYMITFPREMGRASLTFMKDPLVRFGVALEGSLLRELDQVVAARGGTRSELFRDLARATVSRAKHGKAVDAIATLTLVYDHHVRDLSEKLTELQHELGEQVRATLHVHISHDLCLEVIVIRGRSDRLQGIADRLLALRGVKQGGIEIVAGIAEHGHAHAHLDGEGRQGRAHLRRHRHA